MLKLYSVTVTELDPENNLKSETTLYKTKEAAEVYQNNWLDENTRYYENDGYTLDRTDWPGSVVTADILEDEDIVGQLRAEIISHTI